MAMHVERRGDEYCVVIPRQALEAMRLSEGAAVEISPVSEPEKPVIRYISVEEALEAFH